MNEIIECIIGYLPLGYYNLTTYFMFLSRDVCELKSATHTFELPLAD